MGTSVCDYSLTSGANRLHCLIRSLLAVLGLVVAVLRQEGGGGGGGLLGSTRLCKLKPL